MAASTVIGKLSDDEYMDGGAYAAVAAVAAVADGAAVAAVADGAAATAVAAGDDGVAASSTDDSAAVAVGVGGAHAQQLVELDRFIDGEIDQRLGAPNMTWRKLETCFKWRALQEYLTQLGLPLDDPAFAQARELLRAHELTSVEYDAPSRAITRINHASMGPI